VKFRKQRQRFNDYCERTQINSLIGVLLFATLIGCVPLVSAIEVAQTKETRSATLKTSDQLDKPPVTPIFSARRIPQALVDSTLKVRVAAKLQQLSTTLPADSCLTVRTDDREIYSLRSDLALIPGSNMKLLTAAVALDVIKPDTVFSTKLLGVVEGSVVRGDLWLVGSGDPLLSTRDYPPTEKYPTMTPTYVEGLVESLVSSGVKSIQGSVIGDESLYDRERYSPKWGDGIRGTEAGPLGALMINDANTSDSPVKLANPAFAAAKEFTRLLKESGIFVKGSPDIDTAPPDTPQIAKIDSVPLRDIVAEMLTNSDNNTAELLLKEIGRVSHGAATRLAGLQVIANKIVEWQLPSAGVALGDGSGLDRSTQLTCNLLTSLLQRAGADSDLVKGMSIAGSIGTLRENFITGPALNVLRGKTGTLTGVKALSGVFPFSDDHATVFTLLLNGTGTSTTEIYIPIWNSLISSLATGGDSIDLEKVAPLK
jgi:D-alanyl-D-alanine carboxypeptidase/D-alanyl-D-alanine-endopeptidase (penicillin-binding protein 4)